MSTGDKCLEQIKQRLYDSVASFYEVDFQTFQPIIRVELKFTLEAIQDAKAYFTEDFLDQYMKEVVWEAIKEKMKDTKPPAIPQRDADFLQSLRNNGE